MTDPTTSPTPIHRKPVLAGIARQRRPLARSHMLRAARAERLEGELLAGLGEAGRSAAAALHADREAAAAPATLDAAMAKLPAPSEPRIEKIGPSQKVASAANDAAASAAAEEERRAEAEGRDSASLHAAVANRLAAG